MREPVAHDNLPGGNLVSRLLRPRVGWMLLRNTVVSTGVFVVFGLGLLWLLVEQGGMDTVLSTGISFVAANTAHYIFGRTWIFRGTDRGVASGYALFLINGGIGLAITMGSMALLLEHTPINYLAARIVVSVIAGLAMFVLNAVWNFRRV
ncbi:GtrA family protein [Pontixanthobacter aquaemixtae]|uniref:GtrA family protein n=1 Tax=Pontixanthobacter aquaemixtae TaxID=1958940 RepID=A0A844ZUQ8_9SPHN|nr:GtrA family protein [Pontixanthobacter aquaemixtae]MXO91723.1 GtrA family protein [Pontixanthobacter aquaemixtae]